MSRRVDRLPESPRCRIIAHGGRLPAELERAASLRRTARRFAFVLPEGGIAIIEGNDEHAPRHVPPWFAEPPARAATRVAVIGGGLAGAATASALADLGIPSTVFEKNTPARAASGNLRGLLYAKISPDDTAQTRLLDMGYGYSRQLLEHAPEGIFQPCGVLHHDYSEAEARRNRALAQSHPQGRLFYLVNENAAREISGLRLAGGGLWWPHGGSVAPARWVLSMLENPLVRVRGQCEIHAIEAHAGGWRLEKDGEIFSHVVICTGAGGLPEPLGCLKMRAVRGQTSVAQTNGNTPRCAVSSRHYVCPPDAGRVVFGASFVPNDAGCDIRPEEHAANIAGLNDIDENIAKTFSGCLKGHAAARCDTFDHLPAVGAVAMPQAFAQTYRALASDAKRRIDAPCPWLDGVYLNTAHGSRGLSTIPLCARHIAHSIAGEPPVLDAFLQRALHPNRLLIRALTRPRALG